MMIIYQFKKRSLSLLKTCIFRSVKTIPNIRNRSNNASPSTSLPDAWALTYDAQTPQELISAYSQWAPTYDKDSVVEFGYKAPDVASAVLSKHVLDKSSRILDLGVGTGLVGERLAALGYSYLVGVDLSPEMIELARNKAVYRNLFVDNAIAMRSDDHPDDCYDALICVGTFTPNHLDSSALKELVRVVRPGGVICLSLRDDYLNDAKSGMRATLDKLVRSDELEEIEVTSSDIYTPLVSDDITFRCWVYRVC
jgi:SAM-dependent methyltransferase